MEEERKARMANKRDVEGSRQGRKEVRRTWKEVEKKKKEERKEEGAERKWKERG